jgi:5-methylcytosine-specific restriction endonuclease McrA
VVVHVDAPVLANAESAGQSLVEDGTHVSAETSQRLARDATRVVMRRDAEGRIIEVGARTRTIPPALRRALEHRDRGCRFPGCGRRFTQGHHIRHWAHGGPTTLSNLALLCRRHHRAVHEEGFSVQRRPDGELTFRWPNGWIIPDVPPPAAVLAAAVDAVAQDIHIDARTSMPGWLGERLDVGYAIDVLHRLAVSG